jgi:hypothetical protein
MHALLPKGWQYPRVSFVLNSVAVPATPTNVALLTALAKALNFAGDIFEPDEAEMAPAGRDEFDALPLPARGEAR